MSVDKNSSGNLKFALSFAATAGIAPLMLLGGLRPAHRYHDSREPHGGFGGDSVSTAGCLSYGECSTYIPTDFRTVRRGLKTHVLIAFGGSSKGRGPEKVASGRYGSVGYRCCNLSSLA